MSGLPLTDVLADDDDDGLQDRAALLTPPPRPRPGRRRPRAPRPAAAPLRCLALVKTLAICLAFFSLGLCIALPGPTLLDLQDLVHAPLSAITQIFLWRAVGYLAGSFLSGLLFDRLNRLLMMLLSILLAAGGMAAVPWMRDALSLNVCFTAVGVPLGFVDTGGNVLLLDLWGKSSGPYMQAIHFSFGLGAFVAPLLAVPFISSSASSRLAENNTSVTALLGRGHLHTAPVPEDALRRAEQEVEVALTTVVPGLEQGTVMRRKRDVRSVEEGKAGVSGPQGESGHWNSTGRGIAENRNGSSLVVNTGQANVSAEASTVSLLPGKNYAHSPVGHDEINARSDALVSSSGNFENSSFLSSHTDVTTTAPPPGVLDHTPKPKPAFTDGNKLEHDQTWVRPPLKPSKHAAAPAKPAPDTLKPASEAGSADSSEAQVGNDEPGISGNETVAAASVVGDDGNRTAVDLPSQLHGESSTVATQSLVDGSASSTSSTIIGETNAADPDNTSRAGNDTVPNGPDVIATSGITLKVGSESVSETTPRPATMAPGALGSIGAPTVSSGRPATGAPVAMGSIGAPSVSSGRPSTTEGLMAFPADASTAVPPPSSSHPSTTTSVKSETTQLASVSSHQPSQLTVDGAHSLSIAVTEDTPFVDIVSDSDVPPASHARPTEEVVSRIVHVVDRATTVGTLGTEPGLTTSVEAPSAPGRVTPPGLRPDGAEVAHDTAESKAPALTGGRETGEDVASENSGSRRPDDPSGGNSGPGLHSGGGDGHDVAEYPNIDSISPTNAENPKVNAVTVNSFDHTTDNMVLVEDPSSTRTTPAPPPTRTPPQHHKPGTFDDTSDEGGLLSQLSNSAAVHGIPLLAQLYLLSAGCLLLVALIFLALLVYDPRAPRAVPDSGAQSSTPRCYTATLVALMSLVLCFYVGMEVAMGQLLMNFSVHASVHLTRAGGAYVTSVFWGLFAGGRALSVCFAGVLRPALVLALDYALVAAGAALLLAAGSWDRTALLAGCGLTGLGMASIFPAALVWLEQHVHVSSRVAAILVISGALGEMVMPAGVGALMASEPRALTYTLAGCVSVCLVAQSVAAAVARLARPRGAPVGPMEGYQLAAQDDDDDVIIATTNSVSSSSW